MHKDECGIIYGTLDEYAIAYDLSMEIHERSAEPEGSSRKFYARFREIGLTSGSGMLSTYGDGETPEDARQAYAELLSGVDNACVVDGMTRVRRLPKWQFDDREPAEPELIDIARQHYADPTDDNIAIDDDAIKSVADNGVWVQAWVWIQNEELEA